MHDCFLLQNPQHAIIDLSSSVNRKILFHWRLKISGNLNPIIFVKWNAPKLPSVFSQHFSVLPCKLSLGEKKMYDDAKKWLKEKKRQPGGQAVHFFWRSTQKQPHYSFSIVDQKSRINQVKLY